MRKLLSIAALLGLGLASMSSPANADQNEDKLQLSDCHLKGIKAQVQCGSLQVPVNYQQAEGDQLAINFAVLPAIDNSDNKAPLMFLAGGPGQSAVELAAMIRRMFNEVRKTHDIILVDQRGTGKSSPLQCEEFDQSEQSPYSIIPKDFKGEDITECLEQFSVDLSQFTSENAIRDFDAVRQALGHQQIHLYGGSYGTRAALVYQRMFPQSLRSVVLDSVGPIEVPIGLFGQSSARSFNLLVENCMANSACKTAYPNLAQEYQSLIERLAKAPVEQEIIHPRLGEKTTFKLTKDKLVGQIRMQLYGLGGRSLVPLVIHQAYLGNYRPIIGLISQSDVENSNAMYIGLTFNIVCNEDVPKFTPEAIINDGKNNFGGDGKGADNSHHAWNIACPLWPTYSVDESFYQPVTAQIPTLILSGNLDPVTPPSNGEHSAATLPNSRHIIVKSAAHIVAGNGCASDVISEFIETLDLDALDASCLEELPEETFMTSLNGNI